MIETVLDGLEKLLGAHKMLYHAIIALCIGLAALAAGKIVKYFLSTVVHKIISRTDNEVDDRILGIIIERIIALSGLLGLYLGIKELRLGLTRDNTIFLTFLDYSDILLYIVAALILTTIIIKILRAISLHALLALGKKNHEEQVSNTLQLLINRVVSFVIVAITAIVVLDHFGQNISSILTILGAGTLALSLAAQDTISNMISGFVIIIDRPFRVGDRVKIPTGEAGDILEIGLRSTKILDFDSNVLIVPNNELVKTRIVNYSYPHAGMRVAVEVTVGYGSDIEQVKKIMMNAALLHPAVLKDPPIEVLLMKLADSGLNFSLFCRVADFKIQSHIAEALRIRIYNELNKAKIEIPFPQHVVHHKYDSPYALQTSQKRKKVSR